MPPLVILGAGDLAGDLARQLAAARLGPAIILVDDAEAIARGKALDIMQAGPVDRYDTSVSGTADESVAAHAAMLLVADRAKGGEWDEDAGLALVRRLVALNDEAPILCAGARHAALIDRAVGELGLPRERVLGTAPDALRAAVVAMTALEAGCAPRDVSLSVIGRPPESIVVPWSEAAIAGRAVTDALSVPALARLESRLPRLWPPAPFTLAAAAAGIVRSALTRSPRVHAAFVALTREEGRAGRTVALPVRVQPRGLAALVMPALSVRDRVRLDAAIG